MTAPASIEANYEFHRDRTVPTDASIWVFGSNTAGRHGKGSAEVAKLQFGAQRGVGLGPTGRSYAIPTKFEAADRSLQVLPLDEVRTFVAEFLAYARAHPGQTFFVTRIGCELAGHGDEVMAAMFEGAPINCNFAEEWREHLSMKVASAAKLRPR